MADAFLPSNVVLVSPSFLKVVGRDKFCSQFVVIWEPLSFIVPPCRIFKVGYGTNGVIFAICSEAVQIPYCLDRSIILFRERS